MIIRHFTGGQKDKNVLVSNWCLGVSVFPAYRQAGVLCPNKQKK